MVIHWSKKQKTNSNRLNRSSKPLSDLGCERSEVMAASLQLTQAQKRVTYAHKLFRNAIDEADNGQE